MLDARCMVLPPVQRSEQSQQYVEHSTYVVPRHGVTYVDSRHTYVRTFYDGSEREDRNIFTGSERGSNMRELAERMERIERKTSSLQNPRDAPPRL
jgi:hypothetical protein